MGELKSYTPFTNMQPADRTRVGYYNAMKAMLVSLEDDMSKWLDVTYDDTNYKIMYTPKAENINSWVITYEINSSLLVYLTLKVPSASSTSASTYTGVNDGIIPFHFYFSDGLMFVGFCNYRAFIGLSNGYPYGNDKPTTFLFAENASVYQKNTTGSEYPTGDYDHRCTNGAAYCVKPWTVNSYGLINDIFYYIDGYSGALTTQQPYRIGDDTFIGLRYNLVLRLV